MKCCEHCTPTHTPHEQEPGLNEPNPGILLPSLWHIHLLGTVVVGCGEALIVLLYLQQAGSAEKLPALCAMAESSLKSRIVFAIGTSLAGSGLLIYDAAMAQSRFPEPYTAQAIRTCSFISMVLLVGTVATSGFAHMILAQAWTGSRIMCALIAFISLALPYAKMILCGGDHHFGGVVPTDEERIDASTDMHPMRLCSGNFFFLCGAAAVGLALAVLSLRLMIHGAKGKISGTNELPVLPVYWIWLFLFMPPAGITRFRLHLPSFKFQQS
mmetsp:Transcript_1832/g.2130  ORF Transcript_1832/g.2130 Transcript_1832/m.2130 type:complete len:270 (-) Transcript_1832:152-961(-)